MVGGGLEHCGPSNPGLHVSDGGGGGGVVLEDVEGAGVDTDGNPELRTGGGVLDVDVVGAALEVTGTVAVLWAPVTICSVAIGWFGLPAR